MSMLFFSLPLWGQTPGSFGQTLQIKTRVHSFVGRPTWLIEIRDIDHNQVIPYIYDFVRGENNWLAFTYGRNYFILASTLSFSPYSYCPWRTCKIYNFCNLESNGHIMRNTSIAINLSGELRPNGGYCCQKSFFHEDGFTIVQLGR